MTLPESHLFDPRALRAVAVGTAMMLLYGSRLTKGAVASTSEGLVFALKPMVIWARVIGLPAYILFFGYLLLVHPNELPWWFGPLLMMAIGLSVATMPATITLTPTAIRQRYWLRRIRSIAYEEVMVIERAGRGRGLRIVGEDGVQVVHSVNHCGREEFYREIERRTGKRFTE